MEQPDPAQPTPTSSETETKEFILKIISPLLEPLNLEIESLKKKLAEQEKKLAEHEKLIKNQQAEIEILKKSSPSLKNPEITLMEEEIVRAKVDKIRKEKQEQIFQEARERRRLEECHKRQAPFVAALSKGDLTLAKKLESEGAILTEPNAEGMYPLAAAVYGCNLECVNYIVVNLKDEAAKQWTKVDLTKAQENIDKQMPTELSNTSTHGELGEWYIKYANSGWCSTYDTKILQEMQCEKLPFDNWGVEGQSSTGLSKRLAKVPLSERGLIAPGRLLNAPNAVAHNNTVKAICNDLELLKKMVEVNAPKPLPKYNK